MRSILCLLFSVGLVVQAHADAPRAHWIWSTNRRNENQVASFTKSFDVTGVVQSANLSGIADYHELQISLNEQVIGDVENYAQRFSFDISEQLKAGKNNLTLRCKSSDGPSAVAAFLRIEYRNGKQQAVVTDASWSAGKSTPVSFGEVDERFLGDADRKVGINRFDDYTQWKQAIDADKSTNPSTFQIAPGFQIELVHSATKDQGSWVSMAIDPVGRLVIGREDKGLLRMTLGKDGKVSKVETINDALQECRGLLFAHGSLFVNANNSKGFYRLRDTNGDDQFDEVKLLREFPGTLGHGRNDLTLGPDGMIYLIHGDAVDVPGKNIVDRTSPFRENRRGKKMREGHVIRTDKDGSSWELLTAGLRNPYGIDFNTDGEVFTYDADAEFDMGSPWYRPTRVDHLVTGGDFGWRGVTGDWPPYFPDHPDNAQPNLDIGKGSPTSVKFGTRSKFPPKYQRALFILDWAYGRIIAVHMQPRGASYLCSGETFLKGRPLNVTDLDFGPDGSMYFVTGGRKTQAGLYRVSYAGSTVEASSKQTRQQKARAKHGKKSRRLRRRLESLHGKQDPSAVAIAWPHLQSADPWIRNAARIAIEHQPVNNWQDQALNESDPTAALTALMALARSQNEAALPAVLKRLEDFSLSDLSLAQKMMAFHACSLCINEIESLDEQSRMQAIKWLEPVYPTRTPRIDQQMSRLLAKLNSSTFVQKTVKLLSSARDQKRQFHNLFSLRNARDGWTIDGRHAFFRSLRQTQEYLGGQGLPGFLKKIREEATATLTDTEKSKLGPLLEDSPPDESQAPPRPFVKKWKIGELVDSLAKIDKPRDLKNGQLMFRAASCNRCHRLGLEGTLIGPDLTSVARRFSRHDLLESILSPSKVVAENYRSIKVVTTGGRVFVGRVVPGGDYRSPMLRIATDPKSPQNVTEITKSEIEIQEASPVSWMPEGLLDTLSKDEILDLLAFIESGG